MGARLGLLGRRPEPGAECIRSRALALYGRGGVGAEEDDRVVAEHGGDVGDRQAVTGRRIWRASLLPPELRLRVLTDVATTHEAKEPTGVTVR